MKNIKLRFRFQRNWRRAGGVFIGAHLQFPVHVLDEKDIVWSQWSLAVGLVAVTLHVTLGRRVTR